MKNLKKVLGKDDAKNYQDKNVTVSYKKTNQTAQPNPFSKNKKWTDIDDLIECRNTLKKNVEMSIEKHFSIMLEDWLEKDQPSQHKIQSLNKTDFPKFDIKERAKHKDKDLLGMINKMIDKYIEICWGNQKQKGPQSLQKRLDAVRSILERMIQQIGHGNQQNKNIEKCLSVCLKQCQRLTKDARRKEKQKSLKEYDQMIKILKPSGISPKKGQKIQEPTLPIIQQNNLQTLKSSLSGKNLKIKFTFEEYEIKDSQSNSNQTDQKNRQMLKKQKSQGNIFSLLKKEQNLKNDKNGGQGQNQQPKTTEQYKAKLYSLLQQPMNLKVIKKKVQYECDYSAILDASRTNIKQRNKTMQYQEKQKQYKAKVHNKGKKNDAFIFYRPSQKK